MTRVRIRTLGLIVCLAYPLVAVHAQAAGVVMLGDSWAYRSSASFASVLVSEGHGDLGFANEGVSGSTAAQWAAGTFDVPAILAANPDVEVVHIIAGGNDLLGLDLGGDLVAGLLAIGDDVVAIAAEVAANSSADIVITGYDYLPDPPFGVVLTNTGLILLASIIDTQLAADPVLAARATYVDTNGLMQIHFGVPQLGVPPFDPSLPDAGLPGPTTAFADAIHLTAAGYDVYAQHAYDEATGALLIPDCDDGLDNDADGLVDGLDPGCDDASDRSERSPLLPCDDGVDNDALGDVDYPADPGCRDPEWPTESPQCQDGINNDGALGTDFDGGQSVLGVGGGNPFGADPQCIDRPWRDKEKSGACGLGFEVAPALIGLAAARRRRGNVLAPGFR